MTILLGAVADDFTGATDLANTLVKSGLRSVQAIGVPAPGTTFDADAVVVALKSRTCPVAEAVERSRAALAWLRAEGARQIVLKYCSTFDSTERGNIGPVAEALMADLGDAFTIACPSFPANGRTVFRGHLFVGDALISDSSMRDHPLTPMTDANLVRFLAKQTRLRVGNVRLETVAAGAEAIRADFARCRQAGVAIAIVDAVADADLMAIGAACRDLALVTGGSGVATNLAPALLEASGRAAAAAACVEAVAGPAAILSGSCSAATNAQLARAAERWPLLRLDPLAIADGQQGADDALDWARRHRGGPIVIGSTAPPEAVQAVQARLGRDEAGAMVEATLAEIARRLVDELGVRRLVVAGGETSGAVVGALGVAALRIGPEIAPGVPATVAEADLGDGRPTPLALTLKSGNFGGPDFFAQALAAMP